MERRAVIVVLDGVGAGDAPDAAEFGDEGANTLGNTARAVGGLDLPNLQELGLGNVTEIEGVSPEGSSRASHGLMVELSAAKATLAGHWEMMGLVLEDPLPTYPDGFPDWIIRRFEERTGRRVIGNRPASGTQIIEELGPKQEETGAWIVYTSADSVFQVAAHTGVIPLEELYEACKKAETYIDRIEDAGHEAVAVGKIRDIFDGKGITEHLLAPPDDDAKVDAILDVLGRIESGLIFANLVDFDARYGHRRDPEGMAANLQRFDGRMPELLDALTRNDLLVITADHGNDPTFRGTDHTRERVPLLVVGGGDPRDLGVRQGFSDLGASAAGWLGVEKSGLPGNDFLR
jgi:phosphopentomutase